MIDNCTSHGSSQTGRDEGVTGEEEEIWEEGEGEGGGGREEMIGDIC